MALPVDVNTYKSTDPGAPVLNGVAGSLASVLRACLQNGYNVQTPTSVVVASGVATATYASAHGYSANRVILVAGASTVAINGKKRVLSITTNALTFDATGVADGPVAGTITTKMAPLGFTEIFTGTNLAAFKSDDVAGQSRSVLRIDDTATTYARVISYESMADINTGTGPMPTATQLSGGAYIVKSTTADATARPWILVGDGRLFYLWTYPGSSAGRMNLFWWGEVVSYRPGDAFCTSIGGYSSAPSSSTNYDPGLWFCGRSFASVSPGATLQAINAEAAVHIMQRGIDQLSPSVLSFALSATEACVGSSTVLFSGSAQSLAYPSLVTSGLMLFPVFCRSSSELRADLRGNLPGVFHSPHNLSSMYLTDVSGVASAPGRVFLIVPLSNYSGNDVGAVAIDMMGPWR